MSLSLRSYQQDAVAFLRARTGGAGLFLDMGLGKTASSLSALQERHLPALVVAPPRVAAEVWPAEAEKWRPDLTVAAAIGTPAARKRALAAGADITVISRDSLADAAETAAAGGYRTLIIDELSGYKTRGSRRWKVARQLRKYVENVWGLTGTPSPNGLMDLWAQVYLLDGGARLGRTLTQFRERYFTPGRSLPSGIVTEWNIRPGAEARIHALLADLCLSMGTEGRVELPPVSMNYVSVPLEARARRLYGDMKKTLLADLTMFGGAEAVLASSAGVMTQKLSQISAGFLYHEDAELREDDHTVLSHEKAKAVQEIVEGTGSPVLVFYQYRIEHDLIKAKLGEAAHDVAETGIVSAWNRGEVPVLLAHPASAGHGLNLQHGGHTIVWASLPWSSEEYQQANKRLARSGQEHPVVIHHLIAPKTVDEIKRERLDGKRQVEQMLLDHLESPL